MSTFGDGTAHEELYESAETIRLAYDLTDMMVGRILLTVALHYIDPFDETEEYVRKKERKT